MNKDSIDYCGWDIGGAHLKFVGFSDDGVLVAVKQLKCPLWLGVEHLTSAVRQIKNEYCLKKAQHAATMTGELCDNFKNRTTGVHEIINAMSGVLEPRPCLFYGIDDRWYKAGEKIDWQNLASANWHASARFVGRHIPDTVVVDFGSTTVDIIPVMNGQVVSRGRDDFSRLKFRELVYTGMVRTPVSSIVRHLPFDGEKIPVAAESFSNAADVYRILGFLPDTADLYPAMDGGGKSQTDSARRLFRMIGRDYEGELGVAESMAQYVFESQLNQLREAFSFVLQHIADGSKLAANTSIVGLGCGAQLVEELAKTLDVKYFRFDEFFLGGELGNTARLASVCAPAAAVGAELHRIHTSKVTE